MTDYETPAGRPMIVQDAKAPSRERALDQILTMLRHPMVDVMEAEELLVKFIRQTAYDAWDKGHDAGGEDEKYHELTDNPYKEA